MKRKEKKSRIEEKKSPEKGIFKRPGTLPSLIVALLLIVGISVIFLFLGDLLLKNRNKSAQNMLDKTVKISEAMFEKASTQCIVSAKYIYSTKNDSLLTNVILSDLLKNNPEANVSFMYLFDYLNDSTRQKNIFVKKNEIIQTEPFNNYFSVPKLLEIRNKIDNNKEAYWEKPFLSVITSQIRFNFIAPVFDPLGELKGFICLNISIDKIKSILESSFKQYQSDMNAFMFVMDNNGMVISSVENEIIPENQNLIEKLEQKNENEAEQGNSDRKNENRKNVAQEKNTALMNILCKMRNGETGAVKFSSTLVDSKNIIFFEPLPKQNLSMALSFDHWKLIWLIIYYFVIIFVAIGIICAILIRWLSESWEKRNAIYSKLGDTFKKIGDGEIKAKVPAISGNHALETLGSQIENMEQNLDAFFKQHAKNIRSNERFENDIINAQRVRNFFSDNKLQYFESSTQEKLSLVSISQNIKDIGGDFFDYFNLSNDYACVVVGNVSRMNNNMHTAINILLTMNLIRFYVALKESLYTRVSYLNNDLINRFKTRIKVKLFIGIINCNTGDLEFINAGNSDPYFISDRNVLPLTIGNQRDDFKNTDDQSLGTGNTLKCLCGTKKLTTKDTLLLFTPGVLDALNAQGELYGITRFERIIIDTPTTNSMNFLNALDNDIQKFTKFHQNDDYTLLAINLINKQK